MKRETVLQKPKYEIHDEYVKLIAYSKKGKPITSIFDKEDLSKVQSVDSWYAQWDKEFNAYLIQSKKLIKKAERTIAQKITLFAVILNVSSNAPVHHINGDFLDNRKSNLKIFDRKLPNEFTSLNDETIAVHLKNRYGYIVGDVLISKDDLERVIRQNLTWVLQRKSNGQPYVMANTENGRIYLDRYLTYCPEDSYVHHINKNPLDCQTKNLEIKTYENFEGN